MPVRLLVGSSGSLLCISVSSLAVDAGPLGSVMLIRCVLGLGLSLVDSPLPLNRDLHIMHLMLAFLHKHL